MAVNDLIIFRKGTSEQWNSANPILASGEPGYDLTNEILKIGDGVSSWSGLSPIGGGTGGLNNLVEDLSPQLGGDLDLNSYDIINSGNININGNITCDYVYSDLSGTIVYANSGNFIDSLKLNGTNVSISGHTHTSSNITDFNSSVSGLLPVKDIVPGSDISVSNTSGIYTITNSMTSVETSASVVTTVFNKTGSSIPKMTVVYLDGGQGDLPTIQKAIATADISSAGTYGITYETIDNMSTGRVIALGALTGLNTNQFNPTAPHGDVNGTVLYLSPTVSGSLTTTKPYAPYHVVAMGTIVRTHQNEGVIEVRVQNGYELEELHNVAITGVTNGQFLQYNSSGSLWVPSSSGNFTTLQVNGTGVSISGHTHTSSDISDSTSVGRALLTSADASVQRTSLGLGTIATEASGNYALASHTHTTSNITDFNSSVSGLLPVKNILSGSNITISSSGGTYTISSSSSSGTEGSLSSLVGVRGIINTTGTLSSFAVSGGYPVGYLDLFQDGVKLVSDLDFSATDGSNVTLSNSVPSGTILEYLTMASGVSAGGGSLSGSVTIPNLGDLSYSNVSLLLHGEGSNGSTTFTDSSSNPKTITVGVGSPQISTTQSKFGSSSIYLPVSTISTSSSSDFAFGTGNFTVEFWWYVVTLPTSEARLVNFGGDAGYQYLNLTYGFSSNTFTIVNENVAHILNTSQAVSLNQWHHIAYTRSSDTLYLFFNGTLLGTASVGGISTPTTSVSISSGPGGTSYFDDIRITKGVARYTSSFSPPTAVFADASSLTLPVTVSGSSGGSSGLSWSSVPASATASGTVGEISYDDSYFYVATATDTWKRAALSSWDPYFSSVSFLLPMNGTNNSTSFVDAGPSALAVTANGDAKISTAQSKFGGASAVFDGTGDFLSVPNNAAFNFGSGDLAVEAWIYISANSSADPDGNRGFAICSTWAPTDTITGWILGVLGDSTTTGTGLQFDSWNGANATIYRATVSLAHSMWHHVAASVSGGTRRLYLNGTLLTGATTNIGSGYAQIESLGNSFRVGNSANASYPLFLNGYIDDLRITKGSARGYAGATIPVPSTSFPTS